MISILSIPTCPRHFPPSLQHSVPDQQRELAAGTPHRHGGLHSGAASTGCECLHSAGILLLKMSTETGHNTYIIETHTQTKLRLNTKLK